MDEIKLLIESQALLQKQFEIELPSINDFDQLIQLLSKEINRLLDHDLNHLMNILYRIDVSEKKVKDILSTSSPNQIATHLSIEIVARMREKAILRAKYRD
jgi:septum formation inhibitor-activating ATPase MinD